MHARRPRGLRERPEARWGPVNRRRTASVLRHLRTETERLKCRRSAWDVGVLTGRAISGRRAERRLPLDHADVDEPRLGGNALPGGLGGDQRGGAVAPAVEPPPSASPKKAGARSPSSSYGISKCTTLPLVATSSLPSDRSNSAWSGAGDDDERSRQSEGASRVDASTARAPAHRSRPRWGIRGESGSPSADAGVRRRSRGRRRRLEETAPCSGVNLTSPAPWGTLVPTGIAVASRGGVAAVWAQPGDGGSSIAISFRRRGGSWSPARTVPGSRGASQAEVAFDGDGDTVVAWMGPRRVGAVRRAADGTWGRPRTIFRSARPVEVNAPAGVDLAVNEQGRAVASWQGRPWSGGSAAAGHRGPWWRYTRGSAAPGANHEAQR